MRNKMTMMLLFTLLLLVWANIAAAYPRTVVMENFTNWG